MSRRFAVALGAVALLGLTGSLAVAQAPAAPPAVDLSRPQGIPGAVPAGPPALPYGPIDEVLAAQESSVIGECFREVCQGDTWFATVDYLNWKPRLTNLVFAEVGAGPSATGFVSHDREQLDLERDSGVRAEVGLCTCGGWDVSITDTYFHTTGQGIATAPTGGAILNPFVGNAGSPTVAATASANLNYQVWDLQAGHSFRACKDALTYRVFAGPRFADIDQDFKIFLESANGSNVSVHNPLEFRGGGLAVGSQAGWNLCRYFSLFGRLTGSLLIGDFHNNFSAADGSGNPLFSTSDHFERVVPVLETAAGLAFDCGPWHLAVGYELADWFQLVDRLTFTDPLHGNAFTTTTADLGLDGVFVRVGFSY